MDTKVWKYTLYLLNSCTSILEINNSEIWWKPIKPPHNSHWLPYHHNIETDGHGTSLSSRGSLPKWPACSTSPSLKSVGSSEWTPVLYGEGGWLGPRAAHWGGPFGPKCGKIQLARVLHKLSPFYYSFRCISFTRRNHPESVWKVTFIFEFI